MPRDLEKTHGHCADVLMDDYGIPKQMRREVCGEIDHIYEQISLIHCVVIAGVRGWQTIPQTRALRAFLVQHQTHPPKHHNPNTV